MNMDKDKQPKPKGPFPQPAKSMTGDRTEGDSDATRDPARAPGKRTLDRENEKTLKPHGEDASGPAKDTAPQQSRETKRQQH